MYHTGESILDKDKDQFLFKIFEAELYSGTLQLKISKEPQNMKISEDNRTDIDIGRPKHNLKRTQKCYFG